MARQQHISNYYKFLKNQAELWDALDYDEIVFNNRIFKKYGPDYFYDRYYFINGKYYENDERNRLDNVEKMANLEVHNENLIKKQLEKGEEKTHASMMQVPESEYVLWKSLIPSEYYSDYVYRKKLLDAYILSLPTKEEQLKAVKIMCLNDQSTNYLAFLDLVPEEMNNEQRELFRDLATFYENEYLKDFELKQSLAQKAMEAKEKADSNSINTNKEKFDFLSSNNLEDNTRDERIIKQLQDTKDIENILKDIEQKQKDIDAIINNNQVNESIPNTINDQKLASNDIDWSTIQSNNNNIDNNYQQYQQQVIRNNNSNQVINEMNQINNIINNSLNDNNIVQPTNNNIDLSAFNTIQSNMNLNKINYNINPNNRNKTIINKEFNYTQFVKSPIVYNIQDLIDSRMQEENNNREIVNEMVQSTIYYNNQYANANISFKPTVIKKDVTSSSNQQSISRNNDIFANNRNYEQPEQKVSLSSITNKSANNQSNSLNSLSSSASLQPKVSLSSITNTNKQEFSKTIQQKPVNNNFGSKINLNLHEEEKFNFVNNKPINQSQIQQPQQNKILLPKKQQININQNNNVNEQQTTSKVVIPSVKMR